MPMPRKTGDRTLARWVLAYWEHHGVVPSGTNIASQFGFRSRGAALNALKRCERQGLVKIAGFGSARRLVT